MPMLVPEPDPALTRRNFEPGDGRTLPCISGRRTEYHEPASGLRLRVTPTGARSWLVSFWSPTAKTQRRLKLGDAARMALSDARKAARDARTAVDKGRDPFLERSGLREQERGQRRQRAEERRQAVAERARRAMTFGDLCDAYVEWRRTMPGGRYKRPASPRTLVEWECMLKLHVRPIVGAVSVEDVTRDAFVRVLERAVRKGGPSMGPRVRELLSAVWRWAESRPSVLGIRLPSRSPLLELPRDIGVAAAERERTLTPAEVWKLWRTTESQGLPGLALRFMLLTAARVKEATELPLAEVDLQTKVWRLPAARNKGGRDREIPLSPQAVDVLKRAGTIHEGPHVFDALRLEMRPIREAMGGEPWQPRDLRRTAATLCARLGADPFTVALVLGHAHADERMPAVTRTYLRWSYQDKVREALERLGAWVDDTVHASEEPGAVVEFRR